MNPECDGVRAFQAVDQVLFARDTPVHEVYHVCRDLLGRPWDVLLRRDLADSIVEEAVDPSDRPFDGVWVIAVQSDTTCLDLFEVALEHRPEVLGALG